MEHLFGRSSPWTKLFYLLEDDPLVTPYQVSENVVKILQYFYVSETVLRKNASELIDELELCSTAINSSEKAKEIREVGNALYKEDKETHALNIYEMYTAAIFKAPPGSGEVALAHANRAACLMILKMFQEAYDDCECALLYGYEEKNVPKLLIRQMHCASALKSKKLMAEAIAKMRKYESRLNKGFKAQFSGFVEEFESLEELKPQAGVEEFRRWPQFCQCRNDHQNLHHVAYEDIAAHEPIISEKAFAFAPIVPVNEDRIHYLQCSHCALELIIPFPCIKCKQVSYCSLRCKRDHEKLHKFECLGLTKKGLLQDTGIALLILRTFQTGFQELQIFLDNNEEFTSPEAVWNRIFDVAKKNNLHYHYALHMTSNLNQLTPKEVYYYSFVASVLVELLKKANFFEQFASRKSVPHWEIAVAALLLRHMGQIASNAEKMYSIAPAISISMFLKNNCRVRLGKLHLLSDVSVYMAFYPRIGEYGTDCLYIRRFNVCFPLPFRVHPCKPNLYKKFNKSICTALASKNIAIYKSLVYCFDETSEFSPCKYIACTSTEECEKREQLLKIFSTGEVMDQLPRIFDIFRSIHACDSGHPGTTPNHNKMFLYLECLKLVIKQKDSQPFLELRPSTWDAIIKLAEDWLEANEGYFGIQKRLEYAKVLSIYLDLITLNDRKLKDIAKIQNSLRFLPDRIRDLYAGYIEDYVEMSCIDY